MPKRFSSLAAPSFRISVVRPKDFLSLEFEFVNLKRVTRNPLRLHRERLEKPAYMIVEFPPQNITEEAFFEKDKDVSTYKIPSVFKREYPKNDEDSTENPPLPVRARLAGLSRLVFRMPNDVTEIDYNLDALLRACREWPLNLAPGALPAAPPQSASSEGWGDEGPPLIIARIGFEALATIGTQLVRGSTTVVQSALKEQIAATVNRTLVEVVEGAGVGDLFDVDAIVSQSVQQVLATLPAMATQAVSETDATTIGDLFDASVNALTVEVSKRVELIEQENDLETNLTGWLKTLLKPVKPGRDTTNIELPYRLLISPNWHARWMHSLEPVSHKVTHKRERTELWHTRLAIKDDKGSITEAPHEQRTLRAIWSPDYVPISDMEKLHHTHSPFRMSLTARDRAMLVHVTAGYDLENYTPVPTYANQLMLSSLGGWLDTEGQWTDVQLANPLGIEMRAWKHQSAVGRDYYVRVVYDGFLLGFGHGASLIKVTERKFKNDDIGNTAYLRQRYYLVPRELVRTYPGEAQMYGGRQFPFTQVRIKTLVTPNLDEPSKDGKGGYDQIELQNARNLVGADPQALFWPFVGEKPFEFEFIATTLAGQEVEFSIPVIFISIENGLPFITDKETGQLVTNDMEEIINAYNAAPDRRRSSLSAQTIPFAPANKAGDTDQETDTITFTAQLPDLKSVSSIPLGQPHFYPAIDNIDVRNFALQRLLGNNNVITLTYPDPEKGEHSYLNVGFEGKNSGEVFLTIDPESTFDIHFRTGNHGDKAGGLVSPDFSLLGLSRIAGPVGGKLETVAAGIFKPKEFFQNAKFLGGLSLDSILDNSLKFDDMPKLTYTHSSNSVTTYSWNTKQLFNDEDNIFIPLKNSELSIESTIATEANQIITKYTASLSNFKINLFGFIILWFDDFIITAPDGKKPDVDIVLDPGNEVTFGGPLEFVNVLREYIPSKGFSDPPDLDVTQKGLTASYTLGLPPITMGMFLLENVKMRAVCSLPFDSNPAYFRFNFAERYDTFVLTVSALGGGGFFALAVQSDGVKELEVALEFVGSVALNVGVASGGVYIKAGIYYQWTQNAAALSGYVEVGGALSVIGLITVSLVFHMSLTYTDNGKIWGQATLVVEIDLTLISKSVDVTVERQFKGSEADPSFAEMYSQADWDKYCEAFA